MSVVRNKLITLDKIKLQQKLSTSFAAGTSGDGRFSLVSDNGVYIFELNCNSENWLPIFSMKKGFFAVSCSAENSAYVISDNVGIDINNFIDALNQYDIYESILDVNISQNLKEAAYVQIQPISAQWSAAGLDERHFCLLGVLTNMGVLEIVARKPGLCDADEYYSACNLTGYCVNALGKDWKSYSRRTPDEQLNELKSRVDKVRVTAFAWGHLFKVAFSSCSYIFCGHGDGGVSAWTVMRDPISHVVCIFSGYFKTSLKHITTLSWLNGSNSGLLFVGDRYGRIAALIIKHFSDNLEFDETVIYSTADNITVENITQFFCDELLYVVIAKGTFVVVAVFDINYDLLDQKIYHCGNLAITGLERYENNVILILTFTGVLKELQLFCENGKLHIKDATIRNDVNWQKYRAHGLFLSHNRVFVGLVLYPCNMKDLLKVDHYAVVAILRNFRKSPMKLLLNNQTGTLRNHWDCLETLRVHCFKSKRYPCEKYPFILKINYDKLTLLELKTLLHVSRITKVISTKKVQDVNRNIESSTIYDILVQIKLAIKRMKDLVHQHQQSKTLSEFQMNSLEIVDSYLREVIMVNTLRKYRMAESTANDIYDLMAYVHNLEFPAMPKCFWCKETISGLTCFPPHVDTRCAISFLQISGPALYKCLFCKCAIHKYVVEEEESKSCPFCDMPLRKTFFNNDSEVKGDGEPVNGISDACSSDCLTERLDLNDVEEEAVVKIEDFYRYIHKSAPNWDEISISEPSSADNSDIDYIFNKELACMRISYQKETEMG